MTITRAVPTDAMELTAIAIAAKGHWGYPARWMAHWRPVLTVSPSSIALQETYVLRSSERIAGFSALRFDGQALHLESLFVRPEEMGRGVGRALFVHALERAREQGFASLEIQSDPNAVRFYERMGATRVGSHFSLLEGQRRELPMFRCRTGYEEA